MTNRRSFHVFLGTLLIGWGLCLPVRAQVSGLSPITVPTANLALGSQYGLVMEFSVTAGTGTDAANYFGIINSGSGAQGGTGLPHDITAFKLWFQTSPVFSPALSTPVTVTGSAPFMWGGLSSNLSVTSNGYLFVTADMNSNSGQVNLGDTFQLFMPTDSVTFNSGFIYPTSAAVTNSTVQTLVAAGTASAISMINVPNGNIDLGTTNNLVYQFSVTTSGTAVFQTIQLSNTSSAAATSDISAVKLWYQAGGGTFNASSANFLETLTASGSNSWLAAPVTLNWNVNNGDNFYVTVDISSSATRGNACQFQVPGSGVDFSSGALPLANTTNSGIQTIPTLTPTPTHTATSTSTATHTSTATFTATWTASSTGTPTATTTVTATASFTTTYSSTATPTESSTPTNTGTPTASFTPTATSTPTATVPFTATFTSTPSPTPTSTGTASSTGTPTTTSTPTATLPFTATFTPTRTPISTPTIPTVIGLTITPTPNVLLYLDSNFFKPQQNSLGMDVRVYQNGQVKLQVFNMAGERVRNIANQTLQQGNYRFYWDGLNDNGALVGNGVYYMVIQTPAGTKVQKVILLK